MKQIVPPYSLIITMKKIIFSLVAMMIATMSFAQNQIATLTHGDSISTFYGPDSFKSAVNAARDGDVISLSSGTFNASSLISIEKNITVRGAGMLSYTDSLGYHESTTVTGIAYMKGVNNLRIEGVNLSDYGNLYCTGNITFVKCNIRSKLIQDGDSAFNATLINCRVRDGLYTDGTATCLNSVISRLDDSDGNRQPIFYCNNCIITDLDNKCNITNGVFQNCYLTTNSFAFYSSNVVSNCYSNYSYAFAYQDSTNKVIPASDMFQSYNGGDWYDDEKFLLTDESATTYLGDDGKQMGLYGGMYPYEERMAVPRIAKCTVAKRATTDGKLSVDIQVEDAK